MSKVTRAVIAAVTANVDEMEKELLRDDAEEALTAAYNNLKQLFKEKYTDDSELIEAIYQLEEEDTPDRRRRLAREVDIVEADDDPVFVEAADDLLMLIRSMPGGDRVVQDAQ